MIRITGRHMNAVRHARRIERAERGVVRAIDPPRMAYGIHEAPGDPNHVYFCASRSYAEAAPEERVGLYRFVTGHPARGDSSVLDVPATDLMNERPIVYADNDSGAPELGRGTTVANAAARSSVTTSRCHEDGRRIYFSEPFDYTGASVDDALDEAIALSPNGRLWRYQHRYRYDTSHRRRLSLHQRCALRPSSRAAA